jgi:hypothetical protein
VPGVKALLAVLFGGCAILGGQTPPPAAPDLQHPSLLPLTVGQGAAYRPSAGSPDGRPIRGTSCVATERHGPPLHLELFAHGHVVVVPAGLGIAPPRRGMGAYVAGGRCRYPVFTQEPTGLVHIASSGLTLRDLFAIWGQPLSRHRLGSFRSVRAVRAYVGGRRWAGPPGAVPLEPGLQIVVEIGRYVPPHPGYEFPGDH